MSDENDYYKGYSEEHPEPSNAFVRAAADGNIEKLRRMIEEGSDINQYDKGFQAPDGYYIRDMRDPNTIGATAIEMAMRTGNFALLKFLVAAGADLAPIDPYDHKPTSLVMTGIHSGFVEGVRYLADDCKLPLVDPDKDPKTSDAWLLVWAARKKSSADMLRYLIEERGFDPALKTENGITAARAANSRDSSPEVLEYLFSKGGVPSGTQNIQSLVKVSFAAGAKKDLEGITGRGFDELEKSMEFSKRYTNHSTLLNEAVFHGDLEKVRIHLKHGTNPLEKDAGGVDAFGILEALKSNKESFFDFREEHAAIEETLKLHLSPSKQRVIKGPNPF